VAWVTQPPQLNPMTASAMAPPWRHRPRPKPLA
jgi:hypothetical protein